MSECVVVRLTEEDVWARLDALNRAHPGLMLAWLFRDPDLDRCCQSDEIAYRFGWDVASELDGNLYLLGLDS